MTTREEIMVKAGFDNTAIASGLRGTSQMLNDFASRAASALVGIFSVWQVGSFIKGLADFAENISLTAKRLNVTTTEAQQLSYAARIAGTDLETVANVLDKLAKAKEMALGEAGAGTPAQMQLYKNALAAVGINIDNLRRSSLTENLDEIGAAFQRTGGNAQMTANMMQLFGRGVGQVIPMLKQLKSAQSEAPLVSDEDINEIARFDEKKKSWLTRLQVVSIDALSTVFSKEGLKNAAGGLGVLIKNPMAALENIQMNLALKRISAAGSSSAGGGLTDHPFLFNPEMAQRSATQVQQALKRIADAKAQYDEAGTTGYTRVNALLQRRNDMEFQLKYFHMDEVTHYQTLAALAENDLKLKEAQAQADQESIQDNRQLRDLKREQAKLAGEEKFTRNQSLTPYLPTLEAMTGNSRFNEMLQSQYFHGGQFDMMRGSPYAGNAQELMRLQYQYAWNLMHPGVNSDQFVEQQAGRIQSLKGILSKAGVISPEDAYKALMDNTKKTQEGIDELVGRMHKDGIPVTIASN